MPHALALAAEMATTALAVAGIGYFLIAWLAARIYLRERHILLTRSARRPGEPASFAPGVSILKSLKGLDPGLNEAFASHCRQDYPGEFELLFGVSSLDEPAIAAVEQLRREFPQCAIRLIECPERLGPNGKVSSLAQLAVHARYEFLLINDSDITVSPRYLERVMAGFAADASPSAIQEAMAASPIGNELGGSQTAALENQKDALAAVAAHTHPSSLRAFSSAPALSAQPPAKVVAKDAKTPPPVGLVTSLYRGRAHRTLPSHFEALGIATDFAPGVLVSKWFEGGLRFGLGATLAVRRDALEDAGGLLGLVDYLADDYELGARVAKAGYRVALSPEIVETAVPPYRWRDFADHQMRWLRTVREARPWGYTGMVVTHGLGWALINLLVSGLSPISLWLLALSFFLRLALAMTVGSEVLGDHHVLASLWLVPLRDFVAMGLWAAGFAGDIVVWRGERFTLHGGKLR
jgi:hypothetical protein